MCGLGAILRTDGEPIPDAWLDLIDARIAHRGPDGHGRFHDRVRVDTGAGARTIAVALVHRRLSIIDHADGQQPMVSPAGRNETEDRVAVAFNGCIYNHRALRRALAAKGHRFLTDHSDTEVLIHGHREWRERLDEHLEGMYAYAIWDRGAGRLMLGRDWFGEKPLYILRTPRDGGAITIAASDARAVADVYAAIDGVGLAATPRWTDAYLQLGYGWRGATCYGPAPERPEVVLAVPPGLPARLAAPPPPDAEPPARDVDAFADLIEKRLDRAVAQRLEADVPLGCFLSGGVDSSLVACFAKRHRPDLRTFSVRMPDPRYDESPYAERVAAHLGTEHATLDAATDPARDLVELVHMLGQPFGDSSILPTYWVSRAARRHVKVAVAGDGADELFLGYERYMAARALARGRAGLRFLPSGLGARAHPKSAFHKLGRLGHMARDLETHGVLAMESIFTGAQRAELLGGAPAWSPPRVAPDPDAMAALRAADVRHYLPGDLLTKVDTASMAVALEVRCPFLDRALAEAALSAPLAWLTAGRGRKGLLRRVARRHLPAEVIDRPKMGFAIPVGQWFRTDHGGMRTLLMDQLTASAPFGPLDLDRAVVQGLIQEHMSEGRDHGQRLFALLTLSIWARG